MPQQPIKTPAGYLPAGAIAFAAADGGATLVSAAAPLPIVAQAPAPAAPLVGTTNASTVAGPFAPTLGRAVWLTLSGTWSGTVRLLRSTDGGATRVPLTLGGGAAYQWSAAVNEPVLEESVAGATYYLAVTLAGGTLDYRVQQ